MGTLWIDATDLKRWMGPKTGISRVLDCVARELLELPGAQAKLCVFDEAAAAFRSFETTGHPHPDLPASTASGRRSRGRIARLMSSLIGNVPQELRDPLRSIAYHAYHFLLGLRHLARSFGQWLRQLVASPTATVDAVVEFSENDVLLALGYTWAWHCGYVEAVSKLKQHRSLKVVHFIHDVIPAKFPHFCAPGFGNEFRGWALNALSISDLVLSNSRKSKEDIEAFSRENGCHCPPIDVIRLGDEISPGGVSSPPALEVDPGQRFVLCVGTIEARKNQALLYLVWSRLLETYGSSVPKLVLVGPRGWFAGDFLTLVKEDPALRNHVIVLKGIKDSELVWLYQHCLFTVYPSIYEGWGLPVAESLARGKYCVTSGNSSMPEIAGDLLDYHSPWDSGECYRLVERAFRDASFLEKREHLIRERYKTTSWKETAGAVLASVMSIR